MFVIHEPAIVEGEPNPDVTVVEEEGVEIREMTDGIDPGGDATSLSVCGVLDRTDPVFILGTQKPIRVPEGKRSSSLD